MVNYSLRNYASSNIFSIMLLVTIIYFISGRLGLYVAIPDTIVTPFWIPSGVALAAVILLGYQVLPSIFLGSFLVNSTVLMEIFSESHWFLILLMSFTIGIGASLQAAAGTWLIQYFIPRGSIFFTGWSVLKFLVCSGLSAVVNSSIGSVTMIWSGLSDVPFYVVWKTWFIGDLAGIVVMTPLILVWVTPPYIRKLFFNLIEISLLSFSILGIAFLNYFQSNEFFYLFIPLIFWAGISYSFYGATLACFVISILAALLKIYSYDLMPFNQLTAGLLQLALFIIIVTGSILVMVAELKRRPPKNVQWKSNSRIKYSSIKNKLQSWRNRK